MIGEEFNRRKSQIFGKYDNVGVYAAACSNRADVHEAVRFNWFLVRCLSTLKGG